MCPSRNWLSLGTKSFTPPSTSLARGRLMLTTDMEAPEGPADSANVSIKKLAV